MTALLIYMSSFTESSVSLISGAHIALVLICPCVVGITSFPQCVIGVCFLVAVKVNYSLASVMPCSLCGLCVGCAAMSTMSTNLPLLLQSLFPFHGHCNPCWHQSLQLVSHGALYFFFTGFRFKFCF